MYYDDGYEYEVRVEPSELPENCVRVIRLENGTVFEVNNLLLEFENNILYEVEPAKSWINPYYKRTGRIFTLDQINKMVKDK